MYVRSGASWSLEQKVAAPDPQDSHLFGHSVAVSGDTLVVGAYNDDDAGANAGAVYVFTRSGGEWLPEAKLIGSMVAPGDRFGLAVAIDGDTVVAGADTTVGIGSAYVFTRSAGVWSEEAWIPSGSVTPEDFGAVVAVQGDIAVVGAPGDDSVALNRGAAYVFERSGGAWTEVATLLSPTHVFNFGQSIALDGGAIAVGTAFDGAAAGLGGGVVVFTRTAGVWQLHEKITAFDAAFGDFFGNGVALQGKTLAVAAMRDDDAATDAGSVYLYDLDIVTNQPPDCSAAVPSVAVLWPPDHKMVTVGIDGVTDPDGDEVTITVDAIYQDEPVDGKGDGETSPDGAGVGSSTAQVRAERAEHGDGRVYHILFTATDGQGGSSSGEILVAVPRNRSCSGDAVDGGALFDSMVSEAGHRGSW